MFLDSNGVELESVSLEETRDIDNQVQVYPNPSNHYITFKSEMNNALLKIVNANGKLIYKNDFSKSEKIDLSLYPAGIYFYTVHNANKISTGKFIEIR